MTRSDELLLATTPEWSHETVLDCHPASGLARAFVCHHLVAHRLFHLVDIASVVVVKLTSDAIVRSRPALRLTVAKAGSVVLLRVEDTSEHRVEGPESAPVDATFGSGVVGLLTLEWGVTREDGEAIGLWATLDARRHRRAVATVENGITFAGPTIPTARGGSRRGTGGARPGRASRPRREASAGEADSKDRAAGGAGAITGDGLPPVGPPTS